MSEQKKSPLAAATANGQGKGYKVKQNKYITGKAKAQMMAILAAAVGIFIGTFIGLQLVVRAEEELTAAWVLCQPDSYVNIRERASMPERICRHADERGSDLGGRPDERRIRPLREHEQ